MIGNMKNTDLAIQFVFLAGLIMFRNTNDAGFGKICGPGTGDTMRSFGKLKEYCDHYYPVYQCTLVCFAGCLLIIISMVSYLWIYWLYRLVL